MLTTAALNVAIDRVAYRPLRRSTRLAPLITAIGVSFMLENLALLWKGPAPIAYPDVFPSVDILREWFGVDSAIFVTTKDVLVVGATIPLMVALNYFVTRTRWGKAMRATAQDRETAQAMGINVERTILLTFFVGGALAGAAGLIQGIYYNIGMWWMGYQAGRGPSPRPCSAASATCPAPRSAGSSSDFCRRGATSTSPRAGPTRSSSRSSFSSLSSVPRACWARGRPTRYDARAPMGGAGRRAARLPIRRPSARPADGPRGLRRDDLRAPGPRAQHRGRLRAPARPRLRRVLRARRLRDGA